MGGWAPRWRRALLEMTAQVHAVVRRAGRAHAPEGVTEHGRGRRRCPLSEGSGDYPPTGNGTDAVPAQFDGLTTVWSPRVPGGRRPSHARHDFYAYSVPLRVGREESLTAAQAWDEDDTPFPER